MLRSIEDLRRFSVAATDGNLGSVGDVYFDDRSWSVRYLAVDAGNGEPGRRVLVSPSAVRRSEPPTLQVALRTEQVKAGPVGHTPKLRGTSTQPREVEPANLVRAGESGDVHLHAATAVIGYAMQTEDGEIGHVKDVLVDDQAWAIRYLVVDTEKRWVGQKVWVSPAWLTHVTWDAPKTLCCIATAAPEDGRVGLRSAVSARRT
jgi:sporulation protein YlmC with PRC-barrel domain